MKISVFFTNCTMVKTVIFSVQFSGETCFISVQKVKTLLFLLLRYLNILRLK